MHKLVDGADPSVQWERSVCGGGVQRAAGVVWPEAEAGCAAGGEGEGTAECGAVCTAGIERKIGDGGDHSKWERLVSIY